MKTKMWNRVVTGAVATTMLATLVAVQAAPVSAATAIKVTVNQKAVAFPDQKPILDNNRVLIPVRFVSQALGGTVDYKNKTVIIKQEGKTITMKINSAKVSAGGKTVTLDVPAKVVKGRTMVPLRFVSEAMGATVDWKQSSSLVAITTGSVTTPVQPEKPAETAGDFKFDMNYTTMAKQLFVNNLKEENGKVTFTVPDGVTAYHREANGKKSEFVAGKQYTYSVGKGQGILYFTFVDPAKVVPGAQKQAEQYTISLDGSRWGFNDPNKAIVEVYDSKLNESYGSVEKVTELAKLLK